MVESNYNSTDRPPCHSSRRSGLSWIAFAIIFAGLLNASPVFGGIAVAQNDPLTNTQWEFYRGNEFSGHSQATGLLDSWPASGPPVLWTCRLGQGYSGFTSNGDHVFSQAQTMASQFVICLDAGTGETRWKHRYEWSYQTGGLYPGPRSTPTLDADRLYFTSPSGNLSCLNQKDGELIWQVKMTERFDAEPVDFGYACSPVIVDNLVILPVGGPGASVVAFDKIDGTVVWKSGTFAISYASVLPIERSGRKLIVAYLKNDLVLFDTLAGHVLDSIPLSSGYDEHSAWPVYAEPHLWISAPFRKGSRMLKITDSDPPEFVDVWALPHLSNDVSSSVLVDGFLYGFDIRDVQSKIHRPSRGQFRCIDFLTGKPQWENGSAQARRKLQSDNDGVIGHCSVIYADGKLILLNDTGELILLRLDPLKCVETARIRVLGGEIGWTQPLLMNDGRILLRNHSRAVCLFLGDPATTTVDTSDATSVADLPQSSYFDLASWVFSIEPEYAMDAPSSGWILNWYWVMLCMGWGVGFPLAVLVSAILERRMANEYRAPFRRYLFRTMAIGMALMGTYFVSRWMGDFVFTWPLVLAIVFEIVVYQIQNSRRTKRIGDKQTAATPEADSLIRFSDRWTGRISLFAFGATCLVYFLFCRRLSLAFEWSFLMGFPAALPILLLARRFARRTGTASIFFEWLFTGVAFTAFYWTGAAVIFWKY